MKVAMVGATARYAAASDGERIAQLSGALAACGHEVTVYVRRDQPDDSASEHTDRGYRVVQVPAGPPAALPAPEALPYMGDFAHYLRQAWATDRPEVVHAHSWLPAVAAGLAVRQHRLPTVLSIDAPAARSRPADAAEMPSTARIRLETLLVRDATWATAGSSDAIALLAKARHGRSGLSVLSQGVDIERFTPVGLSSPRGRSHRIVMLTSDPLAQHGIQDVIQLLPKIKDAELVVAERSEDTGAHCDHRMRLQRLAEQLGLGERVHLLGSVPGDDLPALLRSADVVACPSYSGTAVTTALQAMASGVAVVAADAGALSDIVVHGVTGLLVPPGNRAELLAALKTLQSQSFRCDGMGAAGRSRVQSRYAWSRIALEAQLIYEQAVARNPAENQPAGNATSR